MGPLDRSPAEQDRHSESVRTHAAGFFTDRPGPSSGSVGPIAAPRRGDRERSRSAMGPDAAPPRTPPPEQRFAARLAARQMSAPTSARAAAVTVLNELGRVDLAVYRAIAGTPAPTLDRPIRRLSAAANWSRLWLAIGGAMAVA